MSDGLVIRFSGPSSDWAWRPSKPYSVPSTAPLLSAATRVAASGMILKVSFATFGSPALRQ